MTTYFKDCKTAEELKAAYRRQAIRLHPDNGGNEEAFKEMQAEFAKMFDRLKNIHVNHETGETYEKKGDNATTETAEEFMNIINVVLGLDGVDIELCGSWLWVSGDTKPHKDVLKQLGFRWSSNKKMWYYHADGSRRRYHKKAWSIDEIRAAYGTQSFRRKDNARLEYMTAQ